jgi:CubicO group peptidase (beta-lactamase class C family)
MHRLIVAASTILCVSASGAAAQQPAAPSWASAIDSMMHHEMARTNTPGAQIAVAQNGRVVYTKGYGVADVETGRRVTDRTLFQTGSLPKLFTGLVLAHLANNGTLDLNAPASRYLPEIAGKQVGTTTAHELLTHSAGWVNSGNPWGAVHESALDDAHRNVGDTMIVPGLRGLYSYSNPSLAMAAYIAERAAGKPFAMLQDSILLRPLGMLRSTLLPTVAMTHDFSLGHARAPGATVSQVVRPMPANAAHWGSGFLYTNTAETARLAIAMMDNGMLDGRRVLSPDAIRAVTTGYVRRAGSPALGVGYGMNTDSVARHRFWQKGGSVEGYRALLTMWPTERLAIVVFVNQMSDLTYEATANAAQVIAGIEHPRLPFDPTDATGREPTAAERAELVGTYRLGRRTFTIEELDGRLVRRLNNVAPITMTGKDRFVVLPPSGEGLAFRVVRDAAGKVHYLFNGQSAFPRVKPGDK